MNLSRRTIVRLITFGIAIISVLVIRNFQLMYSNSKNSQALEYSYMRAIDELSTATDNINTTLEKQIYAGTPQMQLNLSEKLWREASTAKAALEQLPIKELQLENTYKFLSQVGNYAMSISQKASNGEKITDDEYNNLMKLLEFSKSLSDDMWDLEDSINSGEFSLSNVASTMSRSNNEPTISDNFQEFESNFEKYPTLIYDGPFSDSILTKEPKMTKGKDEVSKNKALEKASMSLDINSTDLTNVTEEQGNMPSWVFSDQNQSVTCAVTKNGGYLSYFLKSRSVENEKISIKDGIAKAENFLTEIGVNSLMKTYYEDYNGILTINFAHKDKDICVYTDLIKVSVALDNGEILGYDARGYLTNHEKRSYPQDQISPLKAKEKLSPMLTVNKNQLALIPSDGGQEILCHEFNCTSPNGKKILVYVNAQTGNEEDILILYESEKGTLTM